ncbi:UDP-glucose--hexose-1-phosphate uridylyltransferase [Shewanella sp. 5_MG-2023]|uniref:UDP-glucose--hexose-1-phosphate uridylyltransferase n=1 Tax=unclassified Shewanella TaxID=196818 RepID=UPI000C814B62|nr:MULTISPECIES: UDP-glucose--hexose-1-phosphate uridylyltransferase [unclassified Shewanella]MDO6641889.1 UDP-glucose--hexose-1-phosphate uridylyltransferase [Shewanella sp. 5_MG-2023]PMH99849.1 galactose-1-phosphate uridylyltransferase [Shewanella sp. 10N.286.48.A6]
MKSTTFDATEHPHRRYNPLIKEWVLVSPHRAKRPWQGQEEAPDTASKPSYDETCFLCKGNTRVNGVRNPNYQSTFVFKNDFAALNEHTPEFEQDDPLFRMKAEQGESRVICFSPDHSRSLPELSQEAVEAVVDTWQTQCQELSRQYQWVQVFENKGAVMGCSNPHPHGQIWAQNHLPSQIEKKQQSLSEYLAKNDSNLLIDYAQREAKDGTRTVVENDDWIVVVPFWAAWPFETLLLPKFAVTRMTELSVKQKSTLAAILREITAKYDNLFQCSFPYSMGWHGAPYDDSAHPEWQLHAHFFPPLLRSATVKKFMVGYEMLAEAQRDITPEQAAQRLAALSSVHYKVQHS